MGLPLSQSEVPQAYRLSDLLSHVQQLLRSTYGGVYWIIAEVIEISHSRVGHYYFTLGEMRDGKMVARVQGNLWAGTARSVMADFERTTGSKVDKGMQLMLQVKVEFTPLYGLSLTILGINAEYTLGNLEVLKRLAIERLQSEGVFDMNRSLSLPLLPLRLAVISSDTAAGWGDFCRQIEQSAISDHLHITLFPAIMQGTQTTPSILSALDEIMEHPKDFDAVLVLRGGGSRLDLSAFDDYELCAHLAQFPLPVLTGIGHERDESVADLVAHTRLKTPTALAEYIIRRVEEALGRLTDVEARLQTLLKNSVDGVERSISFLRTRLRQHLYRLTLDEAQRLQALSNNLFLPLRRLVSQSENRIHTLVHTLNRGLHRHLANETNTLHNKRHRLSLSLRQLLDKTSHYPEQHKLRLMTLLRPLPANELRHIDSLDKVIRTYDPTHIMQRGFLPVLREGRPVTSTADLSQGAEVSILLPDGVATAEIQDISKEK